jgi:hypothetical protein
MLWNNQPVQSFVSSWLTTNFAFICKSHFLPLAAAGLAAAGLAFDAGLADLKAM